MFGTGLEFIILFIIFLVVKIWFLKHIPSDTPAEAIVMACGIFINGPMKNIYFLEKNAGQLFTIILFLFWLFIFASYIHSVFKGKVEEMHLRNPIKSFAIGTWIAGTSVLDIAMYQWLPWLAPFVRIIFFADIALWLFYLGVCIRDYRIIFRDGLFNKVHGVLLLSTVSTQSLVVLGNTVFGAKFPAFISQILISLGAILYVFAFVLIIKRYFFTTNWNIEDDWQDTNCIIHGAMSITGLASVVSGAINPDIILVIWLWVILWFLVVEVIELYRACKRVNKYGFIKGIAIYDVTQWSRIFTFGMFYTFTMRLNLSHSSFSNSSLFSIQKFILNYGKWFVVLIIVVEGLLFFLYNSENGLETST